MIQEQEEEKWAPLYGGVYQISNLGNLRRSADWLGRKRRHVGMRQFFTDRDGYFRTKLSVNGKQFKRHVHQLVMEGFVGPRPPGNFHVNHKNGLKTDNRLANLEYVTVRENRLHALHKLGVKSARGKQLPITKLDEETIRMIRKSSMPVCQLARELGVSHAQISRIRSGTRWSYVSP